MLVLVVAVRVICVEVTDYGTKHTESGVAQSYCIETDSRRADPEFYSSMEKKTRKEKGFDHSERSGTD